MPKKTMFLMLVWALLALTACNLNSAPDEVKAEGDTSTEATLEVDAEKIGGEAEATAAVEADADAQDGVAVADANPDTSNLQATVEPPAPLNTAVPPTATIVPTEMMTPTTAPTATLDPTISAMLVRPIDTTLLVWTANGAAPGFNQTAQPGQATFVDSEGVKAGMDLPAPTNTVLPCGGPQAAVSPDGRYYAFYSGTDIGGLYMMIDEQPPALVADNLSLLTCLGGGTFQFSGDSSRFAYIAYNADATRGEFARGALRVHASADPAEVETFDNVAAFDMQFGQIGYVTFFTNDRNEVDEVAVTVWDGTSARELATLNPDAENCRFTSASLDFAPSGDLGMMLGYRCPGENTQWRLYRISATGEVAELLGSDFQPGTFAPFTRSNNVFFSPDGDTLFFTVPDGVTANTVALAAMTLSNNEVGRLVERQMVVPTFSGAAVATPQFSPDGQWMAMVVTSPNNDNELRVVNLNDPTAAPISISAGSRNDVISSMTFTHDSRRLLYIAGGADNADNSLMELSLPNGIDRRIARGRFQRGFALPPEEDVIAVGEWQIPEDPLEPAFLNLVLVNLDAGVKATLFEGADVAENGQVSNLRFAQPLAWR